MFFCEKCRYMFNITKDIKSKQSGGKINNALAVIFNKYNNTEKIEEKDLKKLKLPNILDDERFEKLNKKDQKKLMSQIKATDKTFFDEEEIEKPIKIGTNVAYFICKFCKNHRLIEPGTLIYSKNYNTATIETEDYTYACYDNTLVRTKNYICKNPNCETHQKDSLKEAVLTKNTLDQIVYVCCHCSTNWIDSYS